MDQYFNYLEKMQEEHKLFFNRISDYVERVDAVSDLFLLSKKDKLLNNLLPVAFSGDISKKNSIILFGINPGYDENMNILEEQGHKTSWDDYYNFRKNLYMFFKHIDHPSKYYSVLFKMFSKLYNSKSKWDFFHNNLVNLNLIPYHSKGISLPSKFNEKQLEYLKESYFSQLHFVKPIQPRLYVFNGNPWFNFLIKNNIVEKFEKIEITSKFNIYLFYISKTPAILFDKFFTSHFFGLTDYHRTEVIPKLIHNFSIKKTV